jgi:hypothetical protein
MTLAQVIKEEFGEEVYVKFVKNTLRAGRHRGILSYEYRKSYSYSRSVMKGIDRAFRWASTPEGHNYWEQLNDLLIERDRKHDNKRTCL